MKKLVYLLSFVALFVACTDEPVEPETNFYPLSTGNYWIYEHYNIDSLAACRTL